MLGERTGHVARARRTQPLLPPTAPIETIRRGTYPIPGKTQSDIILGWLGLKRKHPDFLPAYLANCILGQFGMMGRIGEQRARRTGTGLL